MNTKVAHCCKRRNPKFKMIISFLLGCLFIIAFIFNLTIIGTSISSTAPNLYTPSPSKYRIVIGNSISDELNGGDEWYEYSFQRNNTIRIRSNISCSISIALTPVISNINLQYDLKNNESFSFNLNLNRFGDVSQSSQFKQNRYRYLNKWGVLIRIQTSKPLENITFSSKFGAGGEMHKGDVWAISSNLDDNEWSPVESKLETADSDLFISGTIDSQIQTSPTEFYLSLFEPTEDEGVIPDNWMPILFISLIISIIIILGAVFSKAEYRESLKNKLVPNYTGVHSLTMEQVIENENRSKIIDIILENPGIHFNELLRQTKLAPGNLVWHLDILETYKIIGKKNIGQYLVYFPYYQSNPLSAIDIKLAKSKLTLQILDIIEKSPGIYAGAISKILNVDPKTVKYHADKLLEMELISIEKKGRKKLFYPIIGRLSELSIDRDSILNGN